MMSTVYGDAETGSRTSSRTSSRSSGNSSAVVGAGDGALTLWADAE